MQKKSEKIMQGGGVSRIAKQHEKGKMTARERIAMFFDEGTFISPSKGLFCLEIVQCIELIEQFKQRYYNKFIIIIWKTELQFRKFE